MLDPKLSVLNNILIEDTAPNRHFAVANESLARSTIEMTSNMIIGDSSVYFKVDSNPEAERIINDFNKNINVRHQNIDDYYREGWDDGVTHANTLWRIAAFDDMPYGLDISRLDQRTITEDWTLRKGFRCWIQAPTRQPEQEAKTRDEHYKMIQNGNSIAIPSYTGYYDSSYIILPDESNASIHVQLFSHAPVSSAMLLLTYKIWILYFMRKYSEKMWAPPLVGFVGDTKNNYMPYSINERQDEIEKMAGDLSKLRNFSAMGTMGYNRVENPLKESAKSSEYFVNTLKYINEEIMFSLLSSMGIRSQGGTFEATSSVIQEGQQYSLMAERRKFDNSLIRFYSKCLLPYNGISNVKEVDISPIHSQSKQPAPSEVIKSILMGVQSGIFKDQEEVRAIAAQAFPIISKSQSNNGGWVPEVLKIKQAGSPGGTMTSSGSWPKKVPAA